MRNQYAITENKTANRHIPYLIFSSTFSQLFIITYSSFVSLIELIIVTNKKGKYVKKLSESLEILFRCFLFLGLSPGCFLVSASHIFFEFVYILGFLLI
uniref:Uncharacterized protein n=1 Tax=Heterorhabditis bacteriophora TaxID=37862 RepID=A0A1I7WXG9_HETBA